MILNRVKVGRGVTFMKYLPIFNISTGKFNLEKNHVLGIKFADSCRAGRK